jgi:acyl dehydratase
MTNVDTDHGGDGDQEVLGTPRVALNLSTSSIHDADRARRLGFRGSAVAGTTHLDCFVPPLLDVYGQGWFEEGCLSLYFDNVVVSGETVQAVVRRPGAGEDQSAVWARFVDRPDMSVAHGTAGLGGAGRSELSTRDLRLADPDSLRLLKGVAPGTPIGEAVRTVALADQARNVETGVINEPLPWYTAESPWGGPIASPTQTASLMLGVLYGPDGTYLPTISTAIGHTPAMFGAAEVTYVRGPVFTDQPYQVSGQIVGVGESPKTEYFWWDATAHDQDGHEVARLRHLFRIIKAGSPLYPELYQDVTE